MNGRQQHDHVTPSESNDDRHYWPALRSSWMMPGLGLAASRYGYRTGRLSASPRLHNAQTDPLVHTGELTLPSH